MLNTQVRAPRAVAPPTALQRQALWALAASGLPKLLAFRYSGVGAILAFHRIRHVSEKYAFASRRSSIEPENFTRIILALRARDYDFVGMDEVVRRLEGIQTTKRRFVCLTFDDGYDDTYEVAFKTCRIFQIPIVVYPISGFLRRLTRTWSRTVPMWWLGLEQAIAINEEIEFFWDGAIERIPTRTATQKRHAYFRVAKHLADASPQACYDSCSHLSETSGIDFIGMMIQQSLTPAMIAEMQASGLVEFGAHTVNHANLRRLPLEEARYEIADSKTELEDLLRHEVRHFAYPYGAPHAAGQREFELCRELGFRSAVTTHMATVTSEDRDHLHSLPRLTINGEFQNTPLLELLLSGSLPKAREALQFCQKLAGRPADLG
jgi:peptidoglycan/xylan/chitin deacetylase (PgdA/CDA1 family)